jgi:hypothetical protein
MTAAAAVVRMLGIVGGLLLPCAMTMTKAAVQMVVPRNRQPSSTCSRKDDGGGGGANDGVSALSAVPPSLAHAMTAAVAVLMMVPWHRQLSLACSRNNDYPPPERNTLY